MQTPILYLLMAVHVLLAAGTYVFSKAAAVGFPDPESLTLARALGAGGLLFLATVRLGPRPRFQPAEWAVLTVLGLLLVPLNQYAYLRGLRHTVPSHPALFYALTPLGVLCLQALISRRRPPPLKVAGILLALAGVMLVLRPWQSGTLVRELRRGDLWIAAALGCWIVYTVAAANMCRRHPPLLVTTWSLIFGAAIMLPLGGPRLLALHPAAVPAPAWFGLGWLIVVTSGCMMLVWNVLLRHLGPVEVAICTNAQPAATAALAALMAAVGVLPGEQDLGPLFWGGMGAIVTGVMLVQTPTLRSFYGRKRGPAPGGEKDHPPS